MDSNWLVFRIVRKDGENSLMHIHVQTLIEMKVCWHSFRLLKEKEAIFISEFLTWNGFNPNATTVW